MKPKKPLSHKAKKASIDARTGKPPQRSNTHERWRKMVVTFSSLPDLVMGMPIAMRLEPLATTLYFARYTTEPFRVEYQVYSDLADSALRMAALHACREANLKQMPGVHFEICTGSFAHGLAFHMARMLEISGENTLWMVNDVAHWMANQLGFSYAQEAEAALRHAHLCLCNAFGSALTRTPHFQNPCLPTLARLAQRSDTCSIQPVEHLRRAKEASEKMPKNFGSGRKVPRNSP